MWDHSTVHQTDRSLSLAHEPFFKQPTQRFDAGGGDDDDDADEDDDDGDDDDGDAVRYGIASSDLPIHCDRTQVRVLPTTPFEGILVFWATGKILTIRLPKLSLMT